MFGEDADRFRLIFLIAAALFVLVQVVRGWRSGVVRQLVNLLALIVAYAVAIFGGRLAVPVFRPIGYPDFLVSLIAGSIMAMVAFTAISLTGRILFRRTNQQSVGLLRLGYGAGGSMIGMVFGFLTVWLVVLGIRLLGTVAETEMIASAPTPRRLQRPALIESVAHMKESLEQGTTGAIVNRMDPIPDKVYEIMTKIGRVVSSPKAVDRFMSYPGARHLSQHPKIMALQKDASVSREIQQRNYLALLRSQSLVQTLNDPEVGTLVKNFELEKALDYALQQ
ncbi:MAG: hypothetical protein QOD99_2138 [Chthoniobacter sp.]|jgi:uncharacterized membrane protein required for colicin V production|nr:hypothetical protein [Chthoniobacter sp.]